MDKIELKNLLINEPSNLSGKLKNEDRIDYLEKKIEWMKDIIIKLAKDYISNK